MPDLFTSPFTGRVFQRRLPARLERAPIRSAASHLLSESLLRIVRPQAVGRWMMPQLAQCTPAFVENILRGAMSGSLDQQWELFDLMEDTTPRLLKNVGEIKDDAGDYGWKLEAHTETDLPPTPEAEAKKQTVAAAMARMQPRPGWDENGFSGTLFDLADAWYKGTSVLEIDWGFADALHFPRATWWVDPHQYSWSDEGWLGLMTGERNYQSNFSSRAVEPFLEGKFLIAQCKARSGSPLNTALLRALAWWWCAANFSQDWLMNLAQLFGLPFRWATYANNASDATVAQIGDLLANMGSNGYGAFPEGTNLNFLEGGKTAGTSPQDGLLDRFDTICDLLILRQTLTSQTGPSGGGSLALGQVHQSGREKEVSSVASFMAGVLNEQLIPQILELNYGETSAAPRYCPEPRKQEDTKANADMIEVAVRTGIRVPEKWAHQKLAIPLPQAGEEIIERTAPAMPFGAPPGFRPGNDPQPKAADEASPSPGGEGRDAGGLSAPRAKLKAAAAPAAPPADFARAYAALAADLQPVRERLEKILTIEDPQILQARLARFTHEIERLKHDIAADSSFARELEKISAAALAKGLEGK